MAARQRDRKKELFWRRMVRRQAASGATVRAWCREHSVAEYSFYAWRRELAVRDAEQARSAFVPVRVAESVPTHGEGRMEIVLAGRRRVCIQGRVDRQMLSDVLAVLASSANGVEPAFGSEAQARREDPAC